jgi:hypothetical protein
MDDDAHKIQAISRELADMPPQALDHGVVCEAMQLVLGAEAKSWSEKARGYLFGWTRAACGLRNRSVVEWNLGVCHLKKVYADLDTTAGCVKDQKGYGVQAYPVLDEQMNGEQTMESLIIQRWFLHLINQDCGLIDIQIQKFFFSFSFKNIFLEKQCKHKIQQCFIIQRQLKSCQPLHTFRLSLDQYTHLLFTQQTPVLFTKPLYLLELDRLTHLLSIWNQTKPNAPFPLPLPQNFLIMISEWRSRFVTALEV